MEFTCDGKNTTLLTWKLNNIVIRILSSSTTPTDRLMATSLNGIQVQFVSVTLTENSRDRASLASRLVVDPSALRFGDQISCVSSIGIETLTYIPRGILLLFSRFIIDTYS